MITRKLSISPVRQRNARAVYDGIDSRDSDSEENASHFMQSLAAMKTSLVASSHEEDNSVTPTNSKELASLAKFLLSDVTTTAVDSDLSNADQDSATIKLCLERNALIAEFPAFARYIKARAYESGLYQVKKSVAFDPYMNNFFRESDHTVNENLPLAVIKFMKRMEEFTQHYHQSTASMTIL
jgi:hypothetical protein